MSQLGYSFWIYNRRREVSDRIPVGAIGSMKGDKKAIDKWFDAAHARTRRSRRRLWLAVQIGKSDTEFPPRNGKKSLKCSDYFPRG